MGDKTQLLSLILVSRFRKPWVIFAGVFVATLINHGLASWIGQEVGMRVPPHQLAIGLAVIFFAFAAWILIPDKSEGPKSESHHGVFFTTVVSFFLAEMGDKTQLATLALGAKFADPVSVTIGSTLGMLFTNGLAIFLGEKITRRIPMRWIRIGACLLFVAFGIGILIGF